MDVVTARALTKRYAGKVAIDHADMHVPAGAIYGFVGRNGAGKSTMMKMVAGLVSPDGGELAVFGGNRTHRIGVLIEAPGLLPNLSAFDTLMTLALAQGLPDPKAECRNLLVQVGLDGVGGRATKGFSLGMKQRLGLAMALLGGPDLLLLDEPLNGLDPEGAREIRNLLVELNRTRGITIVISSHVLDQLERMCTHYGVIVSGRIVREITAEQVEAECRQSLTLRTTDTARTLAILEERLGGSVRFAAEPDGSLIVSGGFETAEIARILHETNQEVLEMSVNHRDREEYFLGAMEGER